ncbi:DNA-binding protein [Candidatus Woesearchaeota archaeon]|nr:DNA-binding protein [Candidatus Woesearchaeota archaeon]
MNFKKIGNSYVIRLDKGEKILESIKSFCAKNGIKCGHFNGIGAADEAEFGFYIESKKKYNFELFRQPLEIVSLNGNITTLNREIHVHCHAVFGDANMEAIAGHLKEATVSFTCEIFLVRLDSEVGRKYNDKTGLNLMELQSN